MKHEVEWQTTPRNGEVDERRNWWGRIDEETNSQGSWEL